MSKWPGFCHRHAQANIFSVLSKPCIEWENGVGWFWRLHGHCIPQNAFALPPLSPRHYWMDFVLYQIHYRSHAHDDANNFSFTHIWDFNSMILCIWIHLSINGIGENTDDFVVVFKLIRCGSTWALALHRKSHSQLMSIQNVSRWIFSSRIYWKSSDTSMKLRRCKWGANATPHIPHWMAFYCTLNWMHDPSPPSIAKTD